MFATSSTLAKRSSREDGRKCLTKLLANSSGCWPASLTMETRKSSTPSELVGPGSTPLTVTPVPNVVSARPRDRATWALLVRAVVDHLPGDLQVGFGGDEDDAPLVALQHARQIGARKPQPGHDIDFEKARPLRIRDLGEGLRLEDPGVVDENIDAARTTAAQPSALETSSAAARVSAPGTSDFSAATVASTFPGVRP